MIRHIAFWLKTWASSYSSLPPAPHNRNLRGPSSAIGSFRWHFWPLRRISGDQVCAIWLWQSTELGVWVNSWFLYEFLGFCLFGCPIVAQGVPTIGPCRISGQQNGWHNGSRTCIKCSKNCVRITHVICYVICPGLKTIAVSYRPYKVMDTDSRALDVPFGGRMAKVPPRSTFPDPNLCAIWFFSI